MPGSRLLLQALVTFATAWLALRWLIAWLHRHMPDLPNERSLHEQPTPRGGGVVIVAGALLGPAVLLGARALPGAAGLCLAGLAAALIAGVSLLDDLRSLPALPRLGMQAIAAGLALYALGVPRALDVGAMVLHLSPVVAVALALLWVVGLTNAYNFMDGIDTIAAGQAIVGAAGWLALGLLEGGHVTAVTATGIAAGSLAFLWFNWPPARVFMGDTGSAFLGFVFAVFPLVARGEVTSPDRLPVTAVLMVWPFVFDTTVTLVRRGARGDNLLQPHRSHLYQRLVRSGLPHGRVSAIYAAMAIASCAFAVVWQSYPPLGDWLAPTGACLVAGALLFATHRRTRGMP